MSDYMSLEDRPLPEKDTDITEKQLTPCLALLFADIQRGKEPYYKFWFRLKVDQILEQAIASGKFEESKSLIREILAAWLQHEGSLSFTNSSMLGDKLWELIGSFEGGIWKARVLHARMRRLNV